MWVAQSVAVKAAPKAGTTADLKVEPMAVQTAEHWVALTDVYWAANSAVAMAAL